MNGIDFGERQSKTVSNVLWVTKVQEQGIEVNPLVAEIFQDPQLHYLMEQSGDEKAIKYLGETSKFADLVAREGWRAAGGDTGGLFGEEIILPESPKADGSMRQPESGATINMEILNKAGIDPEYVLVFRATTPSQTAKPETYWTTDLHETRFGIPSEMPESVRKYVKVLVADLKTVSEGGLIKDKNDDSGLAMRRIDSGNFDQKRAIGWVG